MSYSRRELYALGEPIGDSSTEKKPGTKSLIYGGGGGKGSKPKRAPLNPANVSTGFGTATANPATGQYSYTLDPRLAQLRDVFYGASGEFLPTDQQNMFSQGMTDQAMSTYGRGSDFLNQALGLSPQEVAAQYYSDIQGLQAPFRELENSQLADSLFKSGRSGAATAFNASGYLNPEQFALLQSRAQSDRALGIEAENLGRSRQLSDLNTAFGVQRGGLDAYNAGQGLRMMPYAQASQLFGLGTGLEGLGQNTLGFAGDMSKLQLEAQAQQQAVNNARASAGKGGGLLGGFADKAFDLGKMYLATKTGGDSIGSLLGGSSPTSGISGLFGMTGFGNNVASPFASYNPINSNIGMGGISAPLNYGGGTLGPTWR
jgi:hypothetical protein